MGTDELSGKSDEMVGENVLLNSIPYRGGVVILLVCFMPYSVMSKTEKKLVG